MSVDLLKASRCAVLHDPALPHESYDRYNADCPACNGTGKKGLIEALMELDKYGNATPIALDSKEIQIAYRKTARALSTSQSAECRGALLFLAALSHAMASKYKDANQSSAENFDLMVAEYLDPSKP